MKKYFSGALSLAVVSYIAFQGNMVQAAGISVAPSTDEVTITNNVGKADTIYITGVTSGDVVTIYNASTKGKILAKRTISGQKTDITIPVSQLGSSAGSVYITVTSKGMTESSRTEASYAEEGKSEILSADNVTVTNNSGKADTIYVSGLAPKDRVKIYTAATGGKLLCSATIGSNKTDATMSISQLGASGGSIYVSVMSDGMREGERTRVDFSGEAQSESPSASNITITNNSGKADTIYVSGLAPSDKVKVYTTATGGKLLASGTVGSQNTELTLNVSQLGSTGGNVYVAVTSPGMTESIRTRAAFSAESQSGSISSSNITVNNNAGKADTIYMTGLTSGDNVKVYNAATGGRLLGSATAGSDASATVSIGQLGTAAGSVYITVTSSGMLESSRIPVTYSAEAQSSGIDAENITVTNNAGKPDTVYISGVQEGNVIKVYNSSIGGNLLGSATVEKGATDATITISQLGTKTGTVYVSTIGDNQLESSRIPVTYSAEAKSSGVNEDNILVANNSGKADTVYVSQLTAGDLVKVYDAEKAGNLLGSATVGDSATDATVAINQLGVDAGSVYVSVTGKGELESSRVKVDYSAEDKSSVLKADNIIVNNNVGVADTVQVSGISSGQVIKVYDAEKGGNLLGSGTVSSGSTDITITIPQLSTEAGSVYVSLSDVNKLEGSRVKADYSAETRSNTLGTSSISITNRAGSADTISITGASQNDVFKVYDLAKGGTLLGSATVAAGDTKAEISITQLGTSAGSVYVSRTSLNKGESERTKADYLAEPKSSDPKAENIIVTNNAGINDTVQVSGLSANDIVKIYDASKGGTLLGSATVANYETAATVSIPQLGTDSGNIYGSITSTNKGESERVQVGFLAEAKSKAPADSKISIVNNAGIAGTVTVSGVTGDDIVKVYDADQGGNLLGSGNVGTYDTAVTISVAQLGSEAGKVYVTVTSKGKLESERTGAEYSAKLVTSKPKAENITVENNAGIQDTVELTGLQTNDVVKVYDSETGGNLLGSATVAEGSMKATVSITQLGTGSGNVYVSLASTGKTESARTTVAYNAEAQSDVLSQGDIAITNNSGTADVIDITGVSANDLVKVYSAEVGGSLLGSATVASGDSEAIINVSQLGTSAGSVYMSVTRSGKTESKRVKADYLAESTAPVTGNISIVNNAVISDTVTVKGLTANDIIKVYDAAQSGNLLGYAIAPANSNEVVVTIPQLTTGSGSVYVSVTNFGKSESKRTKADYIAEQNSTALYSGNVKVENNKSGTADVITVSNLSPSDVIKVYDALTGGNLIGTATVSSNGNEAVITISQLGVSSGNVYMTVTNVGKNESSSRTKIGYIAEN